MRNAALAQTLDAIANRMQVVLGLIGELRRSMDANGRALAELESAAGDVVRLLQRVQPKNTEDA